MGGSSKLMAGPTMTGRNWPNGWKIVEWGGSILFLMLCRQSCKRKCPIHAMARSQNEGRRHQRLCGRIWRTCPSCWISFWRTTNYRDLYRWITNGSLSKNPQNRPTDDLRTMEASSHWLTTAIHPYESTAKSPSRRVHICKTMRMGPHKAITRPKRDGYIGWMNMQTNHWEWRNKPHNYATWRIHPLWRIPPTRKREWKTERFMWSWVLHLS